MDAQPTYRSLGEDSGLIRLPSAALQLVVHGGPEPTDGGGPGEPVCALALAMRDVPIWLRVREDPLFEGLDPAAYTAQLARAYAMNRTAAPEELRVIQAHPKQLARWGAEASASAIYPLADPDRYGATLEEAWTVASGSAVAVITKRFDPERVDTVSWAFWNTALTASLRPADAETVARPWPQSDWLLPGVVPRLTDAARSHGRTLREAFEGLELDLPDLARLLHAWVVAGDAPNDPIGDPQRSAYLAAIAQHGDAGETVAKLAEADLATAQTVQDLRGICLTWLGALRAATDPTVA